MIIFSTDTEIDKHYFEKLKPYISKTYQLIFDKKEKKTLIENNYFWD